MSELSPTTQTINVNAGSIIPDCPMDVGELLAGKYRIERAIGVGGMGVVVSAYHVELHRQVAIKFLRRSFSRHPEAAERFRREARAAAKIGSEHVVRVMDVATLDSGIPYLVMEYLEGENLDRLLQKVGCMSEQEVANILIQVCDALADAHAEGIIHRDLKPENIFFVHRVGRAPVVKVLDFGVSKSLALSTAPHMQLTQGSMLVGSPLYMSPEQLEAEREVDSRADIWGLGVLMFELLTGQLPFQGNSLPQIIQAVVEAERPRLRELNVSVSDSLEGVVSSCLVVSPEDRFESVQQLAEALRPWASPDGAWAERLTLHLQPRRAQALAYGRTLFIDSPSQPAPAVSVEDSSAIEPASMPAPHVLELTPPTLGATAEGQRQPVSPVLLGVASALGGALVAVLVLTLALKSGSRQAVQLARQPEVVAVSTPSISAAVANKPSKPAPTTSPVREASSRPARVVTQMAVTKPAVPRVEQAPSISPAVTDFGPRSSQGRPDDPTWTDFGGRR